MLMPKKTKYRKNMRGRMKGKAHSGNTVSFGMIGLQAIESGYLTTRQIESARRVISRTMKRGGKTWIRVFPYKPITRKPAEVRMGKGKGTVDTWVVPVRSGNIIYEVDGIQDSVASEALKLSAYKLPFKTRIIKRASVI